MIFLKKPAPRAGFMGVLVSSGCPNKVPQTGWLRQQEFVFLQFWRLEV